MESQIPKIEAWFREQGRAPFPFQREVWQAFEEGKSGLIHSATGSGKTLAAWLGPLTLPSTSKSLKILWITPLRALANDTLESLRYPANELAPNWNIEMRTGDTSSADRRKQAKTAPDALVTTPESLTLMMSRADFAESVSGLHTIVVDELHELIGSKRGTQTELALARIRKVCPDIRIWGVSATLGNLQSSLDTLLGPNREGTIIRGETKKEVIIESVVPPSIEAFPWSGHIGLKMIDRVAELVEQSSSSLIFTNTRSQCEIWYNALVKARPEWQDLIRPHHGSIDRAEREEAERGLKNGDLKAVVCTSSLDLGVDFSPVEQVIQIASPKSIAKLLQRAGRSGHQPGVASKIYLVPTHSLELIDTASARVAAEMGKIESREPLYKPLDVLSQHLVTLACGAGFEREEILAEVRDTVAYRDLQDIELSWCLDFVMRGGNSLQNYPEYRKVTERDGRYTVEDKHVATRHRLSIGTIVSDLHVPLRFANGKQLGTVEESFIARLKAGDRFLFAGKLLEFVRFRDNSALVKPTTKRGTAPRWAGGRMALSSELSLSIRERIALAKEGIFEDVEMQQLIPLLRIQADWSGLPAIDEILCEQVQTEEGYHCFIYPLEGRLVHEGLAALFALRISRLRPQTITFACNDYGLEIFSPDPIPFDEAVDRGLFSTQNLAEDILESINAAEMAKRKFREIARVAGLVFQGYPDAPKTAKQVQISSGLLFDVFQEFDKENLLLMQAQREVLEHQLEFQRTQNALNRLGSCRWLITHPPKPTPFAFPILVDRLRSQVTSETLESRIENMSLALSESHATHA